MEGSSWDLVVAAQQGDRSAFAELYAFYFNKVYGFIYRRVSNRVVTEDLTSETFLRALQRIGSVTYQGKDIGAWLIVIARNIVLDYMKSCCYKREYFVKDMLDRTHNKGPESIVIDRETSYELWCAIVKLNVRQRQVVELRFRSDLKVSETALAMNSTQGAVKILQARALRNLRKFVR